MDASAILDYTRPVFYVFSFLGRALILPLRLASVPLLYFLSVLRIVFAPAIYLVAYIASWFRVVFDFIIALQPLYTFLATAAAVGIFAGFTLATSSTVITSYLGMQEGGSGSAQESRSRASQGKKPSSSVSTPTIKDDSSSNEGEWYWPDPSPSRRRPATGLLSQTILEEEDDYDV
ncbi:hypothetical protein V8C35DRAFT_310791 [Trichoderma chlorosporum]